MSKKQMLSYEEKLKIMHEYLKKNEALKTGIRARTMYGEYPIGQWQANMRRQYYSGKLDLGEELEREFLDLGILRKKKERETSDKMTWEEKYVIMEEYLKSGQSIEGDTVYKGYKIGEWQTVIRHLFYTKNLTSISPELKKKFFKKRILRKEKGKPINKGSTKTSYDKKFDIMYRYLESTGFEQEIHQDTVFEGHRIGVWQDNLRQTYRKGRDLLMKPELMENFFSFGILREVDKNKRQSRISGKQSKTSITSESDNEIDQMVEILLRKQEERKALDLEIAELQERIRAKTNGELEI